MQTVIFTFLNQCWYAGKNIQNRTKSKCWWSAATSRLAWVWVCSLLSIWTEANVCGCDSVYFTLWSCSQLGGLQQEGKKETHEVGVSWLDMLGPVFLREIVHMASEAFEVCHLSTAAGPLSSTKPIQTHPLLHVRTHTSPSISYNYSRKKTYRKQLHVKAPSHAD